jgi:hypothetical protein
LILLFMLPAIAGMTNVQYCAQPWLRTFELFVLASLEPQSS